MKASYRTKKQQIIALIIVIVILVSTNFLINL